jgi:hypothetical protein
MKNPQLERAYGFLRALERGTLASLDLCASASAHGDLSIERHTDLIAELSTIETMSRLARECVMESIRRKLRESGKEAETAA